MIVNANDLHLGGSREKETTRREARRFLSNAAGDRRIFLYMLAYNGGCRVCAPPAGSSPALPYRHIVLPNVYYGLKYYRWD